MTFWAAATMAHFRGPDLALLFGLAAIWGVSFMFISLGLDRFSPFTFAALRFDITFLFLLAIVLSRGRGFRLPQGRAQWGAVLAAGTFMTCTYHAFLFWGQDYTTPAVAAVIVGLSPVLTTIFSHLMLRDDNVGVRGVIGLLLGFSGIIVLATLKPGDPFDQQGIGELAVVVAIASWALGSVLVRKARHGMDVFTFSTQQTFVGAVLLHGIAFVAHEPGILLRDTAGAVALLYVSIISSGLGFLVYFYLVERVGPIRVNLVSYIAPIFATLAGFLVLKHPFEPRTLIAFALIAGGFLLVVRAHKAAPMLAPEEP
jgi:drug/metabolite transporter (DMT)-like permease